MIKKLVVIYGLPRTGTTYLFRRFQEAGAHGTYQKRDEFIDLVTEEPRMIGNIARERIHPGSWDPNQYRKLIKWIRKILEFNENNHHCMVTKHPMYTAIADLMKKYLDKFPFDTIWINLIRDPLDIIMSMDAQREYMWRLIHNKPGFNRSHFQKMPFFFHGIKDASKMLPEERAVHMIRSMQRYEKISRYETDPIILPYGEYPQGIDEKLEELTGINPGLIEHWKQGSGRNHKKATLDKELIEHYLRENPL